MYRSKKIVVVVPAHNEARHIAGILSSLPSFVDWIVVVDDGSQDRTVAVVRGLKDTRIRLLQHSERRGVGHAVMTGYEEALRLRGEIIVTFDADGQMDPCHLRAMIRPIIKGECRYTKGNRFCGLKVVKEMPFLRLVGNVSLSFFTLLASGYWNIWDSQSGYTAIDAYLLHKLPLRKLYGRYGFYNSLLIELHILGCRVKNTPVHTIYRDEKSKLSVWRDVPRILWVLVTGFINRLIQERKASACLSRLETISKGEIVDILVVTTSFPRSSEDPAGNFINKLISANVKGKKFRFTVVAPADPQFRIDEKWESGVDIFRFHYFWPRSLERLAYGNGIAENLRVSWWARFQVPFFFVSLFVTCLRHAKKADLIHAHWMVPAGLVAGLVSRWTGVKLLITVHGSDLHWLQRIRGGHLIARTVVRQAQEVTVTSENGRKILYNLLKGEENETKKISVLPLGVEVTSSKVDPDTAKEALKQRYQLNGNRLILFMGRLIFTKGLDLLLRALSGMKGVTLLVAGDGYEKMRLRREAQLLGVDARFLGWVFSERIPDLLKLADCVVIPSRDEWEGCSEGLPMVLLEALVAGCPVVASAVGGIPEIIHDRINGILVTPNKVEPLRQAIQAVVSNEGLRNRLRSEAKKIGQDFDLDRIADRWEQRYLKLMKE